MAETLHDTTPSAAQIVEIFRNQLGLEWKTAIAEPIDNAFDAGATEVLLYVGPCDIWFKDNGSGMREDAMVSACTLGRHLPSMTTALGRYGIGLKQSLIWMGAYMSITSVHENIMRSVEVPWPELRTWSVMLPHGVRVGKAEASANGLPFESGTFVRASNISRRTPSGKALEKLAEDLGAMFSPAIESGRKIKIHRLDKHGTPMEGRPIVVLAKPRPRADGPCVNVDINISGRTVRVEAYVVSGRNDSPGFDVIHGHRMIEENAAYGVRDYSIAGMHGRIILGREWKLDVNKRSLNLDEDRELLDDAISKACADVFRRGSERAGDIYLSTLSSHASEALNSTIEMLGKAKRTLAGKSGTHGTSNSKRVAEKASKGGGAGEKLVSVPRADNQSAPKAALGGKFHIDFVDMPEDEISRVRLDTRRVEFNRTHPFIASKRASGDVMTLLALASLADACSRDERSAQLTLPLVEPGVSFFSRSMAAMLKSIHDDSTKDRKLAAV